MGVKPEDIERAIANGNKVMAQLKRVCPSPEELAAGSGAIQGRALAAGKHVEQSASATHTIGPTDRSSRRIRQSHKPLMNGLESDYFHSHLTAISAPVSIQDIRFRLANGLWYKSDFVVWWPKGPESIEVKGPHAFRGGFENLKMAAHKYPWIEWTLVWKACDKWMRQTVLP